MTVARRGRMRRSLRLGVGTLALLLPLLTAPAVAQSPVTPPSPAPIVAASSAPDVIRGRVTDDSARAIAGATVIVTRGPDRLVQQSTTDSAGDYRIRFDDGTGDYLVYVTALGYASARRRVQRANAEREFVANFTLGSNAVMLATQRVMATAPARATNPITPFQPEPGASERWSDGVTGQIPPGSAGDLDAVAGTRSNVTVGPNGPSILGAGAESNLATLNGLGLATGSLPRAARTETRVTGATYDPTRGGFSGANVDVRLGPGSRTVQRRTAFLTLDPPALQFGDPSLRGFGSAPAGFRASAGADGELIRQALTYNVALDVGRSGSSVATLASANSATLLRAGVAPDSVARLAAVAAPLGLSFGAAGIPTSPRSDQLTWLGRLDDTRDTMRTRAFTSYAGFTRDDAVGLGPLTTSLSAGERKVRRAGVQLTLGDYVGTGDRVLTETRLGASQVALNVRPYRDIPAASVLVRSDDTGLDASAASDVVRLALGGGSYLPRDDTRWTLEGANETAWNAGGRRHRFKSLLSLRADGLEQRGRANELGSFAYASIADLEAGRPSSFSRTLSQPTGSGSVWNAAAALAHNWAPTRFFSLLYGARVEGSGFGDALPRNPALETALPGLRTGAAPTRLHVSPRVGFSYTYNRDRNNNGSSSTQNSVGRFVRTPVGVIRGGVGEFRDLLRPEVFADASAATGLPGATSMLSCTGAAVPAADWALFASDPGAIPTQCVDGSGVLGERSPPVALISPSYDVPRSWRASLDWQASMKRVLVRLGGLASYDLAQSGTVDANFRGESQFTLPNDGNRPVFVSPAAFDAGSGLVSAAESRRSAEFGRVATRVSDLRGYGGQLTAGISPDIARLRNLRLYGALDYTLQGARRQYRGFDGGGFGDPRDKEWAANPNAARHAVILSGGFSSGRTGTVTLFARTQSGLPFTPIVQGDPNGDGIGGDRAFVPATGSTDDPALTEQLRALIDEGAPSARECLLASAGGVAQRNGCRGPWTTSLNVRWRPPLPRGWARRATPIVYLQNVSAGVDQLVHGGRGLRGWGSAAAIDPVLFVPRGFDAETGNLRYDVNTRFAESRAARTLSRDPFRVVLDVSVDFSTDYDLQQLRRAVEPVRSPRGWERRTGDSLAAFYLRGTSSVHRLLLSESDSLFLSATQIMALRAADSLYSARVRAIYVQLGAFLEQQNGGTGTGTRVLDSVQATQRAYSLLFWEQPEIAAAIVTSAQRTLVPLLASMLEVAPADRPNSQYQFGNAVPFSPNAPPARGGAPGPTERRVQRGGPGN